jgi:hypothetical protein
MDIIVSSTAFGGRTARTIHRSSFNSFGTERKKKNSVLSGLFMLHPICAHLLYASGEYLVNVRLSQIQHLSHLCAREVHARLQIEDERLSRPIVPEILQAAMGHPPYLNALDAILMLFNGINAYRQQMPEFTRIHGIILDAGRMPNIIPDHSSAKFYIRSTNEAWEARLIERFSDIVKGAALMTGTEYKMAMYSLPYMSRKPNVPMNDLYFELADKLGMKPQEVKEIGRGSSDFGNFSHTCPGIHAYFAISDHQIPGHSIEMAEAAHSDFGFDMAMKAATAMSAIALRFFTDGDFRKAVREDFERGLYH